MAKEKFENRRLTGEINIACKYDDGTVRHWNEDKAEVVAHIVEIVNRYQRQGYVLTLRQLHYQLVTKNWIVNHQSAYEKLGDILDDCRYSGIIDWSAIEDRGRVPYIPYSLEDAADAVQDSIDTFRINRQEGQSNYVELWTEKDALSGILRRVTSNYHIHLVVNKGYMSTSAAYVAYHRMVSKILEGCTCTILYFGDHDPSGIDMIRDIRDRITFFLVNGDVLKDNEAFTNMVGLWWDDKGYDIYTLIDKEFCSDKILKLMVDYDEKAYLEFEAGRISLYLHEIDAFKVVPIGLTMDQIKEYNLPPNPAKMTDSRAKDYVKKYGKTCWEVDALEPKVLTDIVDENIRSSIDIEMFHKAKEREESERSKLEFFKDKL